MPKEYSLAKFQDAQELALRQLNVLEGNDVLVFQAFLLYLVRDRSGAFLFVLSTLSQFPITTGHQKLIFVFLQVFLFERGYYRTASVLVSLASCIAQRLGLHKDPSWYMYSPWESEWRRRLWNLVILLDQKAIALEGLESALGYSWDTQLPANVSDSSWNISRYAKPSETPVFTGAFSNVTPLLLKRQLLAVLCPLRQNRKTRTYEQHLQDIEAGFQMASKLYLNLDVEDDLKDLASFTKSVGEIEFATLRLMAGQTLVRTGSDVPATFQEQ
jgi:hypothetical protein